MTFRQKRVVHVLFFQLVLLALWGCGSGATPAQFGSETLPELIDAPQGVEEEITDEGAAGVELKEGVGEEIAADAAETDLADTPSPSEALKNWSSWHVSACDDTTNTGASAGAVTWQATVNVGDHPLLVADACTVAAWGSKALSIWNAKSGKLVAQIDEGFAAVVWAPGRRLFTASQGDDAELRVYDVNSGAFLVIGSAKTALKFPTNVAFGPEIGDVTFASAFEKLAGRHGSTAWQRAIDQHCQDQPALAADNRLPGLFTTTDSAGQTSFYSCGIGASEGVEVRTLRFFNDGSILRPLSTDVVEQAIAARDTCLQLSASEIICIVAWYLDGPTTYWIADTSTGYTKPFGAMIGFGGVGRGIAVVPESPIVVTVDQENVHYTNSVSYKFLKNIPTSCSAQRDPWLAPAMTPEHTVFLACPAEVQRYTLKDGQTWSWPVPSGTIRDIGLAGDKTCVVTTGAKESVICLN